MSLSDPVSASKRLPGIPLLGLLFAVWAALAVPCRGQTDVWTNTSGGNWSTGGDWIGGLPGALTPASITTAGTYTVTVNAAETAGMLTMNNANATLSITSGG